MAAGGTTCEPPNASSLDAVAEARSLLDSASRLIHAGRSARSANWRKLLDRADALGATKLPSRLRRLQAINQRYSGIPVRPDPWTVLGLERNETRFTQVLGHVLDPLGEHGLGDLALRALLAGLATARAPAGSVQARELLERSDTLRARVYTEVPLLYGRPDALVVCDGLLIVIEVKIDAQVHDVDVPEAEISGLTGISDAEAVSVGSGLRPVPQTTAYRLSLFGERRSRLLESLGEHAPEGGRETAYAFVAPLRAKAAARDENYVDVPIAAFVRPVVTALAETGGDGTAGWWQRAMLTMLLSLAHAEADGVGVLARLRRILATSGMTSDAGRAALGAEAAGLLRTWGEIEMESEHGLQLG